MVNIPNLDGGVSYGMEYTELPVDLSWIHLLKRNHKGLKRQESDVVPSKYEFLIANCDKSR